MKVIVKSGNLNVMQIHRDAIKQRIESVFHRTCHGVQKMTVTLSNVNGPRGGEDIQVKVQLLADTIPTVVVVDTKADWLAAVNSALHRVNNTLLRKLKRKQQFRQRQNVQLSHSLLSH